jgi:hypothetical protein
VASQTPTQTFPYLRATSKVGTLHAGASAPHEVEVTNLHIKTVEVKVTSDCSQQVLSYGGVFQWVSKIVSIPPKGIGGKGQNTWPFTSQLDAPSSSQGAHEQLGIALERQVPGCQIDYFGPFPHRVDVV